MEGRGSCESIDHATEIRWIRLDLPPLLYHRLARTINWTDHHHPHTHGFDRPGPKIVVVRLKAEANDDVALLTNKHEACRNELIELSPIAVFWVCWAMGADGNDIMLQSQNDIICHRI
jgi:hypothetical protein